MALPVSNQFGEHGHEQGAMGCVGGCPLPAGRKALCIERVPSSLGVDRRRRVSATDDPCRQLRVICVYVTIPVCVLAAQQYHRHDLTSRLTLN